MNNTCDAIRVLLDSLPNAHDIAAGRVNDHTAFALIVERVCTSVTKAGMMTTSDRSILKVLHR